MTMLPRTAREVDYPTSDGKPMGETDLHRQDMVDVIDTLSDRYAAQTDVYVTGNLLLFYEEGNRRKHISPDVFMVRGVSKEPPRDYYLLWREGKSPDVVIEITSKTTRREDQNKKLTIYRDILKVPEYFQFDPTAGLSPAAAPGHPAGRGQYVRIEPIDDRLPREPLGLHLERHGVELRMYDPATGSSCRPLSSSVDAERQEAAQQRQLARRRVMREDERRGRLQVEAESRGSGLRTRGAPA